MMPQHHYSHALYFFAFAQKSNKKRLVQIKVDFLVDLLLSFLWTFCLAMMQWLMVPSLLSDWYHSICSCCRNHSVIPATSGFES